jgi:hypothetical protein
VDAEDGPDPVEEEDLGVCAAEVLLAALIAQAYVPSLSDTKAKINKHREMALDWLDWAVCESDRGRVLTEAKAQACANAKKGGGITYLP